MGELLAETLHGLSPAVVMLALLAVFAAAFLRGFTGFGFALAAVPSLSLMLNPVVVVPCTLILAVLAGIQVLPRLRHLAHWRSVWILVAGSLVGSPIGIWLLTTLPANVVRAGIGVVLMLAVAVLWRQPRIANPPSTALGLATGVVSGVLNGSTALAGPPVILYFLSSTDTVAVARASLIMYFFFSTSGTLAYDAARGLIDRHVLVLAAIFFPALYRQLVGRPLLRRKLGGDLSARRPGHSVLACRRDRRPLALRRAIGRELSPYARR